MKTTEVLGLSLPEGSDYVDIETINENFRKLDSHNHDDAYSKKSHASAHGMNGSDPIRPEEIGAATTETYIATITTSWGSRDTAFVQSITVNGLLATDNPIVDIKFGGDVSANLLYCEAMEKVFRIQTFNGWIQVWATEAISTAFPIQLKVVR